MSTISCLYLINKHSFRHNYNIEK